MSDSYYTFVSDHIRDKLVTVFPTMNVYDISELIQIFEDFALPTIHKQKELVTLVAEWYTNFKNGARPYET